MDGFSGLWRSLVAHLTGGQGVAGSNPVSPTHRSGGNTTSHRGDVSFSRWTSPVASRNIVCLVFFGVPGVGFLGWWLCVGAGSDAVAGAGGSLGRGCWGVVVVGFREFDVGEQEPAMLAWFPRGVDVSGWGEPRPPCLFVEMDLPLRVLGLSWVYI